MNKTSLIEIISGDTKLSKAEAGRVVEVILEAMVDALADGEEIALIGFGNFSVSERKSRNGRNPQTGEVIKIPAAKGVRFRPGKNLKAKINK